MMKKKKTIAATAIVMCICAVIASFPVSAKSQGNIVFQDGEVAVYANDIDYLTQELNSLFDEIPDVDKASSDTDFDYVRKNKLQSKGIIDYAGGTVIINSLDLVNLANEIDYLENTYKQIILKYLNSINTYMAVDGSVVHDVVESDVSYYPTFGDLINGISLSQEVYTETTEDSLTKDKGAWVNGEYVVGNGNDVNAAYLKGLEDGFNNAMENCTISYVYHKHTGEQNGAGSGCYQGYHIHSNCPTTTLVSGHCACRYNYEATGYDCPQCGHYHPGTTGVENQCMYGATTSIVYDCNGQPINAWKTICGKTEKTIESATITFK